LCYSARMHSDNPGPSKILQFDAETCDFKSLLKKNSKRRVRDAAVFK